MASEPETVSPDLELVDKRDRTLGRVVVRSVEASHLGNQLRGVLTGDPLPAELREAFDHYLEAVNGNSFAVADEIQGQLDQAHEFSLRHRGDGTAIPICAVFIARDGWFECQVLAAYATLLEAAGLGTTTSFMTLTDFEYHAWFLDPKLPEGDPDREWVACFVVRARTPEEARAWGDHIAKAKALRVGEPFLRSGLDPSGQDPGQLPIVIAGVEPSDEDIGW